MKRSEMIKFIMNILDSGFYSEANNILTMLESKGMLPPEILNPEYDFNEAFEYNKHSFLEYPIKRYVKKWEKE